MNKILLVDDEKDFVDSVKEFLELRGYEIITAYSGIDALEGMKELPDMVILDIKMPNMGGLEVLEHLRWNPNAINAAIVMLTAKAGSDSMLESQRLGANDYIVKPVNLENLLMVIKKYM